MFKWLIKDIKIKLLCFFAATCLWSYVALSQNSIGKFPSQVSVKTLNLSSNLVSVSDVRNVTIEISAKPSSWEKLSTGSFSASIDLAGLDEGIHKVPVKVSSLISDVSVLSIEPGTITVVIEKTSSRQITLTQRIQGQASEGIVAKEVNFSPPQIEILGAKSILDSIKEAYGVVNLNSESESFQQKAKIVILNERGEELHDLQIVPNQVDASIILGRGSNVKTVAIKPVVSGKPASNFLLSSIEITPEIVDIVGLVDTLKSIRYLETEPVSIEGYSKDFSGNVKIIYPDGVSPMVSNQPVKLTLKFSPLSATRTFNLTSATALNLNTFGLSALIPSNVMLTVEGPADRLYALSDADFNLILDFKNIEIQNKQHIFDLTPSNFRIPANFSVKNIDPPRITAILK